MVVILLKFLQLRQLPFSSLFSFLSSLLCMLSFSDAHTLSPCLVNTSSSSLLCHYCFLIWRHIFLRLQFALSSSCLLRIFFLLSLPPFFSPPLSLVRVVSIHIEHWSEYHSSLAADQIQCCTTIYKPWYRWKKTYVYFDFIFREELIEFWRGIPVVTVL